MLVGFKDLGVDAKDDGHTRWAPVHDGGWYLQAPNKFTVNAQNRFWRQVVNILTMAGNGKQVSVHCIGSEGLSVAGPGFTGPQATELLGRLYLENPQEFSDFCAPAFTLRGVYLQQRDGVSLWGLYEDSYKRRADAALDGPPSDVFWLRERSKSGKWLPKQKQLAEHIVEGVGCFLMGCLTETLLLDFTRDMVERELNNETLMLLRWPSSGVEGGWYFSREQKNLWLLAACLILDGRVRVLDATYHEDPSVYFSNLWAKAPSRLQLLQEHFNVSD
jgi:hypothetical protein